MVDAAARSDRIVAVHCHGKAGIIAALRAGCKTIEHGTYMDDECVRLMREKGDMLIATRNFFEAGLKMRELWSPDSYAKLEGAAATHKEAYAMAVRSGLKIALGTDLGLGRVVSSPAGKVFSHGSNGKVLVYAVEAGMTPLEVIEAATSNAAETLGPKMATKSGQVKVGWDADLIAVKGNPLTDIGVLAEAENVNHVWWAGNLYKAPEI